MTFECHYNVAPPKNALGWSAVCNCGTIWLYLPNTFRALCAIAA